MLAVAMMVILDLLGLGLAVNDRELPGWKSRAVSGFERPGFVIARDGAGPVVRISGAGKAAWFYRPIEDPIREDGQLRWSWRVLQAPRGAVLSDRGRDDSPIRVFVAFGKLGGLFNRGGRVIFYSFSGEDSSGYSAPSHAGGRFHIFGLDGAMAVGSWRDHQVNPRDDFRRIWGQEPPPITAIGVMQDTDQTGQEAIAELRSLAWEGGR